MKRFAKRSLKVLKEKMIERAMITLKEVLFILNCLCPSRVTSSLLSTLFLYMILKNPIKKAIFEAK